MTSIGNQRLQTWPFRKRRTMISKTTNDIFDCKIHLDSQYSESLKSIFMTDISKTIEINERNISEKSTSIITTKTNENMTIIDIENFFDCSICCNHISIDQLKQMSCCSMKLCSSCLLTYTIININNRKIKIECPACSENINTSTILYNNELPVSIRERYQQILAQNLAEKSNTLIKLCPHCNFITKLNENDRNIRKKKSRHSSEQWIHCQSCGQKWCWPCYAPAHLNKTCEQMKKHHSQLDIWAKTRRIDNNQRNAQRCPKCSIYIEKIDGCDHMICTKCESKFCYRCGSRMRIPFCIGHDAKYSIFGCKYKLWPNRPLLRWLTRGTIFLSILVLSPVVFTALIALVAIGIPTVLIIGCFALPVLVCLECKRRT